MIGNVGLCIADADSMYCSQYTSMYYTQYTNIKI